MIYKAKLIPLSYSGRLSLAIDMYCQNGVNYKVSRKTKLIISGIEPQTVESKLINIMYGE